MKIETKDRVFCKKFEIFTKISILYSRTRYVAHAKRIHFDEISESKLHRLNKAKASTLSKSKDKIVTVYNIICYSL
jgi:hypothetical protein